MHFRSVVLAAVRSTMGPRIFYRIFYRTGKNGVVIHSTGQHDETRKTSSQAQSWTDQHDPKPRL